MFTLGIAGDIGLEIITTISFKKRYSEKRQVTCEEQNDLLDKGLMK
jgi:hypothetical protein